MNKKGSLFHISKRDALPLPKALLIRGGILLLALVFCGLITTLLTGQDPIAVYGTILKGAFGIPPQAAAHVRVRHSRGHTPAELRDVVGVHRVEVPEPTRPVRSSRIQPGVGGRLP